MRNTYKALFLGIFICCFIMFPALSYADWNGHNGTGNNHDSGNSHSDGRGNDRHDRDRHDHDRGRSYVGVNFSFWPDSYFYSAPYYPPEEEVLVSQPVYQPVVVNGVTYYLNNGVYYAYNGYGYQAIAPPVTVIQPPPVIASAGTTGETAGSFTINIPNNKGGYTAVTLKRSGNGYIGPQGEFYPEFPKVSQLQVIYGK